MKRRIHEKPNAGEVKACRFWPGLEPGFVKPQLVVALDVTALGALTGDAGLTASARRQSIPLLCRSASAEASRHQPV